MPRPYLKCFTLARATPSKDRRDFLLACDRTQALALLALYLDTKQIMFAGKHLVRYRIPDSSFLISRPTSRDIASYLLRGGYLSLSPIPLIRRIEQWIYEFRLFRQSRKQTEAMDEIVIEIFAIGPLLSLTKRPPDPDRDLIVARLHFWEQSTSQTLLRVFIGWAGEASLGQLESLYSLLQGYCLLVEQATAPLPDKTARAECPVETSTRAITVAANGNGAVACELSAKKRPFQQKEEIAARQKDPDEELYQIMDPPRIYGKSLIAICRMAGERQRQIECNGRIPHLEVTRRQWGPSRNTLLKVPELIANWADGAYRWNVINWLRVHSGHTEAEISEHLSRVQTALKEDLWAAVTSAGKEEDKTNKNPRHHHTQDERDSRDRGTGFN